MSSHFSSIVLFNSMLTISIPKKVAVRPAKINGHGRTVRIPAHTTPRVGFQPSAMMVDDTSKDVRPLVTTFTPNMWGDTFSTFSFDHQVQQKYSEEIEALKKEVRSMLMAATSTKLMMLIDNIERLGLAYHFEAEIEEKLKQVYDSKEEKDDYDLFTSALCFRLLRQHQYHVSCIDAFDKFVDKDSKLKESLGSDGDVEGLLSLYEAPHVRIHDENILEEAVAFTTRRLSRMLPQLESPLKDQVQQALKFPLHKSPTVVTLRSSIDIYENDDLRDELLLRLAKLNFNFMQNVFKNELFQLTTWWNKLNLTSKIPYFRDRLVENYMWILAHHFEPQYFLSRTVLLKLYMLVTIMDDTYDNYATLEEIGLFTQAIERWNIDEIDLLPDYLKVAYEFFMSVGEEFECEAEKQGKSYVVPYCIEAIKHLARNYAQERKWIMEKQMPTFEEYMIHARVTTAMNAMVIANAALIKSSTKEILDWLLSDPQICIVMSDIIRLNDDYIVDQHETKDGTTLTPTDIYMKETGASMQETESHYRKMLEDRWKHLNAAWVNCSMIPKEIVVQCVDLARMSEAFIINKVDSYTYPQDYMASIISALFLDSFVV